MKRRIWQITPIIVAIILLLGVQTTTQASQAGAYLYTRATPSVIYADGQDSATIEVFTTNQDIADVSLRTANGGEWLPLYDDGSRGDRSADDGVYTLDGVTTATLPPDMWLFQGMAGTAGFDLQITYTNGQTADTGYAQIRVVDPSIRYPAEQVTPDLYASEYALFVTDPQGEIFHGEPYPSVDQEIDLGAASRKFYSIYPDDFDFLVVMPMHPTYRPTYGYSEGPVPYATTVRAAADNIGVDDYYIDDTVDYGSPERLLTVIYHSADYGSMITHEIGHTWSAFIGDAYGLQDQQYMTAHWDANSDIGGIMGMYVTPYADDPTTELDRSSQGLPTNFNLQANPDGSFRVVDAHGYKVYVPLDLYLMGLIPPEEVPPVHILTNPDFSDLEHVTAQDVKTYTYAELVDMAGGARLPAYPNTQSDFNIGFIYFADQGFSEAEIAWGSMVARESTLNESDTINTFYLATGGRSSLNARLANWGIPDLSAVVLAEPTAQTPTQTPQGLEMDDPSPPSQQTPAEQGQPVWNVNIPCVSSLGIVPFILLGLVQRRKHKKR